MKRSKSMLGLVVAALFFLGSGTAQMWAQSTNEAFYLHFSGFNQLRRGADGTQLKAILKKPETATVEQILLQKLSSTEMTSFFGKEPITTLLDNEVYSLSIEADQPVFVFAAKLGQKESQKRFDTLRAAAKNVGKLTAEKGTANREETWVVKDKDGQSKALAHGCGWLMYYTWKGETLPKIIPEKLIHGKQVLPSLRTNNLILRANTSTVKKFLGKASSLGENVFQVKFSSWLQGESVKNRLEVQLKEEVKLNQPAWQFPTNIVADPLLELTALRGSSNWIENSAWWKSVSDGVSAPDQMFLSARAEAPFLTTLLASSTNVTDAVRKLGVGMTQWVTNSHPKMMTPPKLAVNTNAAELGWVGWPIVNPYLRAASDSDRQYIMAGAVVGYPKGNPVPPALWNAISKDENTFFYSWEMTGQRFPQLQVMNGLFKMLLKDAPEKVQRKKKEDMTPEELKERQAEIAKRRAKNARDEKVSNWLTLIGENLGNCVTQGQQVSPEKLLFERQSSCGLSALELWLLGEWLMDR